MQISWGHQGAVNRQPAYRGWIMEPKKRETKREPFAVAFGKNLPIQNLPDTWFLFVSWYELYDFIYLTFYNDVWMKNMKILISCCVLLIWVEQSTVLAFAGYLVFVWFHSMNLMILYI